MRTRTKKILLAGCATLLALLVCEGIVRLTYPSLAWRPLPDSFLGWSSEEVRAFDAERHPSHDKKRVLFLGDSFLAGSGQRHLGQRLPDAAGSLLGDEYEVRTLATGGWGTDQQLLAFLAKGKQWRPHLVVLTFCAINDISNNLSNDHGVQLQKPYFVASNGHLSLFTSTGTPVNDWAPRVSPKHHPWSYLLSLLKYATRSTPQSAPMNNSKVDSRYLLFDPWNEDRDEVRRPKSELPWSPQFAVTHTTAFIHEDFELNRYAWHLFEAILRHLREQVQEAGGELMVMMLPTTLHPRDPDFIVGGKAVRRFVTPGGGFTFRADEPQRRLRAITGRLGIAFFDPAPEVIKELATTGDISLFWPNPRDDHFSPHTHGLLAHSFVSFLCEASGGMSMGLSRDLAPCRAATGAPGRVEGRR